MDWGLVNRVHADAEFATAVSTLASELAAGPTVAFGRAKLLFHQSTQESLESQMELEAQALAACGHTEDFRNGVAAFAGSSRSSFTVSRSQISSWPHPHVLLKPLRCRLATVDVAVPIDRDEFRAISCGLPRVAPRIHDEGGHPPGLGVADSDPLFPARILHIVGL
jgi:hypothetical protein